MKLNNLFFYFNLKKYLNKKELKHKQKQLVEKTNYSRISKIMMKFKFSMNNN